MRDGSHAMSGCHCITQSRRTVSWAFGDPAKNGIALIGHEDAIAHMENAALSFVLSRERGEQLRVVDRDGGLGSESFENAEISF